MTFPIQVAKLESLIGMLYDVEDQVKELAEAERLARRQSLSRHLLGLIDEYLSSESMSSPKVLPKSNLGQASAYVRRPLGGVEPFHRRRLHPDRQQRLRTIDEARCDGP